MGPPSSVAREDEVSALVVAWAADEPLRAGEMIVLAAGSGPHVIGRGDDEDADMPRARIVRQRPGSVVPAPPLAGAGISRRQIVVRVEGDSLRVERVGRCAMAVDGVPCDSALVRPGGVVTLKRQLVLVHVRRPATIAPLRRFPRDALPEFGAPDSLGIVGESPAAWRTRDAIAFVARAGTHALVAGATGTGKELAARAIHRLSPRAHGPFVARNAATLPPGLIDAELFGHVRNYPNAGMPERTGLVAEANGGTLFLDEIGELPPDLQSHLLRVLDADGEYQRLGEARARRSDFRLVGATNRDPESLKHDLAARLVSRVDVPSLAERREDVPLIARELILRAAVKSPEVAARFVARDAEGGRAWARFDAAIAERLVRGEWPSNVRELESVLWRAMQSSDGDTVMLAREDRDGAGARAPDREPSADEIRAAIARKGGSITQAARALGLSSRFALYRLLKKHGIESDE